MYMCKLECHTFAQTEYGGSGDERNAFRNARKLSRREKPSPVKLLRLNGRYKRTPSADLHINKFGVACGNTVIITLSAVRDRTIGRRFWDSMGVQKICDEIIINNDRL